MNCIESIRIQDYLDGLLERDERARFEAHAVTCEACGRELRLYRRLFARLEATPLLDPGPQFTERVLAAVLPARARRRWVRVAGWAYAASFMLFLAGATVWIAQPGTQEALGRLTEGASGGIVGGLVLLFDALAFAMHGIAAGWEMLAAVGGWFAPFGRAIAPIVTHPLLLATCAGAAVASSVMLFALRAREARAPERTDHVAILGF